MAIYHFSAQILGRATRPNPDGTRRPPSNTVAAAAYRSGERLTDRERGEAHDYSRRKGVVHAEVMAPPGSALWLTDRELLWNTVEAMEKRRDAQLAREFNMALPHELDGDQRLELVRDFVARTFVRRGMVADLALHEPVAEQGHNQRNFHAHVMLTLRRATPDGLDPVKTREWNSKELLTLWRAEWAEACNQALERAGKRERVDHRTLHAQRAEALRDRDHARAVALRREPEIHVGPQARKIVQRGREPISRRREAGPSRRPARGQAAERRVREYPSHDRGTRIGFLQKILIGNDRELYRSIQKTDRQFDRLQRKLDYWERRTTFYAEGVIKGRQFRFERWKAAQDAKAAKEVHQRQVAHAQRRLEQIQRLLGVLERITAMTGRRRELGRARMREVEGWMRDVRSRARSRPQGRMR